MNQLQEPKYNINVAGKIYNRATGVVIPDEEPVMIFRGRDKNAALVLAYYKRLCVDAAHRSVVNKRLHDFVDFALQYPELMKEPDTQLSSYDIKPTGQICNRATGTAIPDEEPVMIFRGRDKNAVLVLAYCKRLCVDEAYRAVVSNRLRDFVDFAGQYPERMKEPDTQLASTARAAGAQAVAGPAPRNAAISILDALQATLDHIQAPRAKRDDAWHAQGHLIRDQAIAAIASHNAAAAAKPRVLPAEVLAWVDAERARLRAVETYNAAVAFSNTRPLGLVSVDPEYQAMEAAHRTMRTALKAMYERLAVGDVQGPIGAAKVCSAAFGDKTVVLTDSLLLSLLPEGIYKLYVEPHLQPRDLPEGWEVLPQDLRTHLDDFAEACAHRLAALDHEADKSYWQHQVDTVSKIQGMLESQPHLGAGAVASGGRNAA